ncbi:MAG: sigma 54-interacting transcriptional regulator [Eubacteriales bacterium]|nr:sigma 54-interacting transcriptional regulator [Eubacteriales bacterium]
MDKKDIHPSISDITNESVTSDEMLGQAGIVAYIDKRGIYRYVNQEWQDKTGIPYNEAVGSNVNDILSGSEAIKAMKTKKDISGVMYYRTYKGREYTAFTKYRPVRREDGEICGCLAESIFENMGEAASFVLKFSKIHEKEGKTAHNPASTGKYTIDSILGVSDATEQLREQIVLAADTNAACLIEGETGTGKELVAHAIHNLSSRNSFPFIRVNCSAIPENLMESEFFGYEEGSFTGGVKGGRKGKFEAADHGSIFLDEINAMSMTLQPKLLRVLQEHEIERIGGSESIPVDARIIAASNKPLAEQIKKGEFRQDLFYRLNIIHITIPPLRDRTEDIEVLTSSFIDRYNKELGRHVNGITNESLNYLKSRPWPGNIRELQNNVERAMVVCTGDTLRLEDFTKFGEQEYGRISFRNGTAEKTEEKYVESVSLSDVKHEIEKQTIIEVLKKCGNNKSEAARELKISRTLLYRKLKKYNIEL